jgi:hypothetical protein
MVGVPHVMATLLYGSGVRGLECVRVRVKEVDFAQHILLVRDGCVPPFTRGILGHEIGLVLGRALRPLVQAYL